MQFSVFLQEMNEVSFENDTVFIPLDDSASPDHLISVSQNTEAVSCELPRMFPKVGPCSEDLVILES